MLESHQGRYFMEADKKFWLKWLRTEMNLTEGELLYAWLPGTMTEGEIASLQEAVEMLNKQGKKLTFHVNSKRAGRVIRSFE